MSPRIILCCHLHVQEREEEMRVEGSSLSVVRVKSSALLHKAQDWEDVAIDSRGQVKVDKAPWIPRLLPHSYLGMHHPPMDGICI